MKNSKILVILIVVLMAVCLTVSAVLCGKKFAKTQVLVIQSNTEIPYVNMGEYTLTWYCVGGITASGNKTNHNLTIAGDISGDLKFNDVLYIKELGKAYVLHDTGRLIKGKRLDVYTTDCEQALQNGVQKSEVYLIGE